MISSVFLACAVWGSAGATTTSRYANASTDFVMRATIAATVTPSTAATRVVLNAAVDGLGSDLPRPRVYWELRRAARQIVLVREDAAAQRTELKSDPYTPPPVNRN